MMTNQRVCTFYLGIASYTMGIDSSLTGTENSLVGGRTLKAVKAAVVQMSVLPSRGGDAGGVIDVDAVGVVLMMVSKEDCLQLRRE